MLLRSTLGAALAIALMLTVGGASSASEDGNLLLNPELTGGAAMPDHWRPWGYARCSSFGWSHLNGAGGELSIGNSQETAVGWTQGLSVAPGWLHLSAELRTEGSDESAAFLAVSQGTANALAFFLSKNWRRKEMYVRITRPDPIEVECGLAHLDPATNAGTVFFRGISLTRISGLPPPGAPKFELGDPSKETADPHHSGIIVAEILLLGGLGFIYYWFANGTSADERAAPFSKLGRLLHYNSMLSAIAAMREPWRIAVVAVGFGLLLAGILVVTNIEWWPQTGFLITRPGAVMGDEPHYIVAINSLLFDHNFQVREAYERVARGGLEAGIRNQGRDLDHHSIFVNRRTGHHAVISPFAPTYATLRPCDPDFMPFDDVYEVSSHPAGFPLLMALAIAPFHPAIADVEGELSIVLALFSWLGALVTYLVCRSMGMRRARAMLAVLLLSVASSWLVYSRAFFSESAIGLALILALWAIVTDLPLLAGLSLAVAAILKPPFALVGIAIVISEIWAGRLRNAVRLAAVLGPLGLADLAFNYWLARTPVIAGNQGWFWASGFHQLYATLLSPEHGLLLFVPWTIVGVLAIVRAFGSNAAGSNVLRQMALPLALYLVLLSCFGSGPEICYGPRFWVPFLPWLAIATVQGIGSARRPALVACGLLVLLGALVAMPAVVRYDQVFARPAWAGWHQVLWR